MDARTQIVDGRCVGRCSCNGRSHIRMEHVRRVDHANHAKRRWVHECCCLDGETVIVRWANEYQYKGAAQNRYTFRMGEAEDELEGERRAAAIAQWQPARGPAPATRAR